MVVCFMKWSCLGFGVIFCPAPLAGSPQELYFHFGYVISPIVSIVLSLVVGLSGGLVGVPVGSCGL